jgi:uncharacterized protein (DUF433 family)
MLMVTDVPAKTVRIEMNPAICGGEACIRGTRIMVWLLVYLQRRGKSDADLLSAYPGLTPDDLPAAWEHFRLHPAEIERDIWTNTVAANQAPGTPIPPWSVVYARLIGMTDDQIRTAFEPPLSVTDLDAAWEQYRRNPQQIDRDIARHRLAA